MGLFKSRRVKEMEARTRSLEAEAAWLRELVQLQSTALWRWKSGEYPPKGEVSNGGEHSDGSMRGRLSGNEREDPVEVVAPADRHTP